MYTAIEVIKKIPDKSTRVSLYMDFIEEYSGWIQHLESVGHKWGAGGERVGAAKEKEVAQEYVERLKKCVMAELEMRQLSLL